VTLPSSIDVPRLRKELEFVTDNPELWIQRRWITRMSCGTAGCLAGNTVLHAGYEPVFDYGFNRNPDVASWVVDADAGSATIAPVRDVAQRLLGLTYAQGDELFFPGNTLYRLWSLAARFTDGELQVPVAVAEAEVERRRHDDGETDW
jgi:hypothetical protein